MMSFRQHQDECPDCRLVSFRCPITKAAWQGCARGLEIRQEEVQAAVAADGGRKFVGRTYIQSEGYNNNAIRFADIDGGVATTTYSFSMSAEEKGEMARRITAALNLTRYLTTEEMEGAAAIVKNGRK